MPRVTTPRAATHLAACDRDLAALIRRVGPCRMRQDRSSPYEALVRAIAHQQLHGAAARAITARLLALFPGEAFPAPQSLLAADPARLRACGFSAAKIETIRGIAAGAASGLVPTRRSAQRLSDAALIERLVSLRGVGRWTVEMLLMFTLARPDVLPVDDFGVREGWRRLKGLAAQPKPRALAEIGEAWAPYRSTAAWYLWRAAEEGKSGGSALTGKVAQADAAE
jgi:DNA-3-methyladenine glycosylase II